MTASPALTTLRAHDQHDTGMAGTDDICKSWTLTSVVAGSAKLASEPRPELQRLANEPSPGEHAEAVDVQLDRIEPRRA